MILLIPSFISRSSRISPSCNHQKFRPSQTLPGLGLDVALALRLAPGWKSVSWIWYQISMAWRLSISSWCNRVTKQREASKTTCRLLLSLRRMLRTLEPMSQKGWKMLTTIQILRNCAGQVAETIHSTCSSFHTLHTWDNTGQLFIAHDAWFDGSICLDCGERQRCL